jgi:hypothetical protein
MFCYFMSNYVLVQHLFVDLVIGCRKFTLRVEDLSNSAASLNYHS